MKRLYLLMALLLALSACNCRQSEPKSDYKSMIRLWPNHHKLDSLNAELMSAIDKYPGACDEVWFFPGKDLKDYDENLPKLKAAAQKMRERGIVVSFQFIAIGHPESQGPAEGPDCMKINELGYRPIVSLEGFATRRQTCPRDTAFAKEQGRLYAKYAEAIQPYAIYIDDDLRLTEHYPANFICFCDECLKQFSERTGRQWTREALAKALDGNEAGVRKAWIRFSQEGLAVYTGIVSEAVHKVSPDTKMGFQHVGFHENLLEGWDWNPVFAAMKDNTGLDPVSRPGHGYYSDSEPRDMFYKAYGISRQIHRLADGITEIAPEIEGYYHKASGKSPQSICTETLLYLGLGATSQSYAIICSGEEPMEWYADNYFRYLDKYHPLFSSFMACNKDSHPCGIDSYISPDQVYRNTDKPFEWTHSTHGSDIIRLAYLGVTLTPESPWCTATTLDREAVKGMTARETDSLFNATGVLMDRATWSTLEERGWTAGLTRQDKGYLSASGKRIAVVKSYSSDINGAERKAILDALDWVSDDKMYVKFESMVQATAVPRADDEGTLRSLVYVNCCISEQFDVTLRLRHCPSAAKFVWHSADDRDRKLKAVKDGDDYLVTIPQVKAWDACWLEVR